MPFREKEREVLLRLLRQALLSIALMVISVAIGLFGCAAIGLFIGSMKATDDAWHFLFWSGMGLASGTTITLGVTLLFYFSRSRA